MDCPRCQLPLTSSEYEGVMVEMCNNCWGFWLDTGELEVILDLERVRIGDKEKQQLLDASHPHRGPVDPAPCPHCQKTMTPKRFDTSVPLIIDQCPDHGVWLDTGEIKKIQAVAEQSAAVHRMLLVKLGLLK